MKRKRLEGSRLRITTKDSMPSVKGDPGILRPNGLLRILEGVYIFQGGGFITLQLADCRIHIPVKDIVLIEERKTHGEFVFVGMK